MFDATWMEQDPFTSPDHNTARGGGLTASRPRNLPLMRLHCRYSAEALSSTEANSSVAPSLALAAALSLSLDTALGFPINRFGQKLDPAIRREWVSKLSRNSKQSNPRRLIKLGLGHCWDQLLQQAYIYPIPEDIYHKYMYVAHFLYIAYGMCSLNNGKNKEETLSCVLLISNIIHLLCYFTDCCSKTTTQSL